MKATEFNYIKKNIVLFNERQVEFKHYIPSADKYKTSKGYIFGIGTDANDGCLIIRAFGMLHAINYKDVQVTEKKKADLFDRDFARVLRKIYKFNEELREYVNMTGDNEVPEIECTIIGTSPMDEIEVKDTEDGIAWNNDGYWEEIKVVTECGEDWFTGEDTLDEQLRYNRRRIRKGVRVWKSENPDAELEKDDEDDE